MSFFADNRMESVFAEKENERKEKTARTPV